MELLVIEYFYVPDIPAIPAFLSQNIHLNTLSQTPSVCVLF
jgi:hypothetical protein